MEDSDWIWDDEEFDFFMSMSDTDKLEYIYEFFNYDSETIDGIDFNSPQSHPLDIDVIITENAFLIKCDDDVLRKKTIGTFMMDGLILTFRENKGNVDIYNLIGTTPARSVNWQYVMKLRLVWHW